MTWYSPVPVGHNTLSNTMKRLCKEAGLEGYKTNHSLRVTAATRLYNAGVDEQQFMQKIGHWSIEGVRIYKRNQSNSKKMYHLFWNQNLHLMQSALKKLKIMMIAVFSLKVLH